MIRDLVLVAGLGIGASVSFGQIGYTSQERGVLTTLLVPGEDSPPFGFESNAGGEFAEAAGDSASNAGDFASASASQFSNLGPSEITFFGSVEATASGAGFATGATWMDASFTLVDPAVFALDATFVAWFLGNPLDLSIVLERSNGTRLFEVTGADASGGENEEVTLDQIVGVLSAGDYLFHFSIAAEGFDDARTLEAYDGTFAVTTVPTPGAAFVLLAGAALRAGVARPDWFQR